MSYDLDVNDHTVFHKSSLLASMGPGAVEWMPLNTRSAQARKKLKQTLSA
jgi:hypothetical protein